MAANTLRARECLRCGFALPTEFFPSVVPTPCPKCDIVFIARVFPAAARALAPGTAGETLLGDDLSSCFFHPTKKATVACAQCGRLVCSLCDLEIDGRHICPACLETGRKEETIALFKNKVKRWDNIGLMLAVLPSFTIVGLYLTLFTAPAALFIVFWKWRSPSERLVHRGKARHIFTLVIALAQIAVWAAILFGSLGRRFF